jgi:putative phosphoesterase
MLVGVIADTHGYVDPRIETAFTGVDAIVLAGDIGGGHVLDALRVIAPVHAVYGNNDEKRDTLGLPLRADFALGGVRVHLVHQLPHAQPPADAHVVVYGHSHRALIEQRDGLWYVNPGAAGRAGFHRVQTVALLQIARRRITGARIVELGPRVATARPKSPSLG